MYLQGINLEMADYDGRTALHVAAAEGHMHLVKFFVNVAKVNHQPRDRNSVGFSSYWTMVGNSQGLAVKLWWDLENPEPFS
ncbi:unnamed protein product [Haemonchus placei]|uniref:ANK_REP_REGION domain-containing protein n=1 Tax=Haemonchus placei TaxID=6290 RepID=A0A0N4VY03_HAEPC|nr:unnamed protein product [Haemonchus placei]